MHHHILQTQKHFSFGHSAIHVRASSWNSIAPKEMYYAQKEIFISKYFTSKLALTTFF